ncbi:Tetratricopeptide repeat-like superfamily protein [Prunus dulcis]|uniref:Tetratricopeptide repeat-like superfamily protein n=1 Tax=Prunus dulcis TaxID=3755 RepID=A0A4Y1R7G1_PRUDU|nr:Tetratricopeptide repeat-like superfamily protein [Prunus dulcis]
MVRFMLSNTTLVSSCPKQVSQMVLTSVHMAFGSVLGHWDLGQSNVISCHLGKALSVLFRAPEESIYGRGTLHQELKQRTLFSFGH